MTWRRDRGRAQNLCKECRAKRRCSVDECGNPVEKLGMCSRHHWRWKHFGDPLREPPVLDRATPCSVSGCENVIGRLGSLGYCGRHAHRHYRYGDVAGPPPRCIPCAMCATTFSATTPGATYCKDCKPKAAALASARWNAENRDRWRAYGQAYEAKKKNATIIPFGPESVTARWEYFGNRCWVCRGEATATDHVKPLNKGGPHMPANLRPICQPCNSSKSDKWPYFADMRRASPSRP
ncbi:HNH endonuclease signature motif containing protein [Nocardia flavorosea]